MPTDCEHCGLAEERALLARALDHIEDLLWCELTEEHRARIERFLLDCWEDGR